VRSSSFSLRPGGGLDHFYLVELVFAREQSLRTNVEQSQVSLDRGVVNHLDLGGGFEARKHFQLSFIRHAQDDTAVQYREIDVSRRDISNHAHVIATEVTGKAKDQLVIDSRLRCDHQ